MKALTRLKASDYDLAISNENKFPNDNHDLLLPEVRPFEEDQ